MPRLEYIGPGWSRAKDGGRRGPHVWKDMGRGWPLAQPQPGASWPLETVAQGITASKPFRQRKSDSETSLNLQFLFQKHRL